MEHREPIASAGIDPMLTGIEPDALYELGLNYSIGQGVPQDLVTAHKWLNLAAQRGSRRARDIRAEIARDMTPSQIAEAQRQAREWGRSH